MKPPARVARVTGTGAPFTKARILATTAGGLSTRAGRPVGHSGVTLPRPVAESRTDASADNREQGSGSRCARAEIGGVDQPETALAVRRGGGVYAIAI